MGFDTYVENLERHGAQKLLLGSDQPIQLVVDGEVKTLRKTCTSDEILALVHEVMDNTARRHFVVQNQVRFAYRSDLVGPLSVTVERSSGHVHCEISRAPGRKSF